MQKLKYPLPKKKKERNNGLPTTPSPKKKRKKQSENQSNIKTGQRIMHLKKIVSKNPVATTMCGKTGTSSL